MLSVKSEYERVRIFLFTEKLSIFILLKELII